MTVSRTIRNYLPLSISKGLGKGVIINLEFGHVRVLVAGHGYEGRLGKVEAPLFT